MRVQVSTNSVKDRRQCLSKPEMHLPPDTIPPPDFGLLRDSAYTHRHEHGKMKYWELSKFPSRLDC